jgi:biotin carboxyl carrier protein
VAEVGEAGRAYRVTPLGEEAREVVRQRETPSATGLVQPLPTRDRSAGQRFEVVVDGWRFELEVEPAELAELRERARRREGAVATREALAVRAQIPGRVLQVWIAPGESVLVGQRLLSVEAMKMENEVRAPRAGTIAGVSVEPGTRVELGDELLVIA